MILTGAFLAEAAAAVDNKLHVWGGVLSHFNVGEQRIASFVLVVLLQHGEDDSQVVEFELVPPNGEEPLQVRFDVPQSALNGEIAFAFWPLAIGLPFDGRWVCVVSAGGGSVSLPMTVRTVSEQE